MKVTIWDLDYYYAKNKKNCFNPDAMKISSYHKQSGDTVLLVQTQDDINRPYDLYYIIKEKEKTPQPPTSFFLNPKVRWWGKCYRMRINWKMNDVMLGCRSDYQLYPAKDTKIEKSEHIRLFNNDLKLIPKFQSWKNSYGDKFLIVTDSSDMWFADKNSLIIALQRLQEGKNISFLEPIWLQKLISDKEIREEFLKLKFTPGSQINWMSIKINDFAAAWEFILEFKKNFPYVAAGNIIIDYRRKDKSHWEDKQNAIEDFNTVKQLICRCKKEKFKVQIRMPNSRFETPYFLIFETLAEWTKYNFQESWLEFISKRYGQIKNADMTDYWCHPQKWDEVFRDLLRQTYQDKDFLTFRWGDNYVSENDIPWKLWDKVFEYGL